MTAPTITAPTTVSPVSTAQGTGKIDLGIQQRVAAIINEMNVGIKDRAEVIHGAWVGRVAQEHLLMVGPGGTGKSYLARTVAGHIDGSVYFETAFDETTDPSQVFGPPDIKAMVEQGKTRRIPTGMFPEATDAFLDEFFNANGPLLHSIMPALNERVFHNNGIPSAMPLRQALMGTNKLNADADQAALWDRVHLRYNVGYVTKRADMLDMVAGSIERMASVGRGTSTGIVGATKTIVTLAELDQAHKEALALDVDQAVLDNFFDIRDELKAQGIVISDRRMVEGMAAVLGNAWVRGHEQVRPADLDILAAMWWTVSDQMKTARDVILSATNPGEKAALDLLDELDKLRAEKVGAAQLDTDRARRVGVELIKNSDKLLREANDHLVKAKAAGADLRRIQEAIDKTEAFKVDVGKDVFGIDPKTLAAMQQA